MSNGYVQKVDVSARQLRGIYSQLLELMEERINKTLPANEVDDSVRREVQLLVQEYLNNVMEMSTNSVNVTNVEMDGQTVKDLIMKSQEKYVEPFDVELNEQVRQLYQEWENLSMTASQLRQTGPAKVNDLYNKGRDDYLEEIDQRLSQLQQNRLSNNVLPEPSEPQAHALNRIFDNYEDSLQYLNETSQKLPSVNADLEKLKHLMTYFGR